MNQQLPQPPGTTPGPQESVDLDQLPPPACPEPLAVETDEPAPNGSVHDVSAHDVLAHDEPVRDEPVPLDEVSLASATTTTRSVMERPHPATPVIKGWMALVGLVFLVGKDLLESLGKDGEHFGVRDIAFFGFLLAVYVVVTGIGGFFSWRTTRFVIDDQQVRIEHNFIQHSSDKIPFTKIQSVDVVQPFAARLLGLAQLRIDVGASEGRTIEFLGRGRAYQMRDYLVARAHGQQTTVAESAASRATADALHDLADDETVLLRVPPQRLVLAAVLSSGFLVTLALSVAAIAGMTWAREFGAVVGIIPLLTALAGIIGNSVVKQWNYALVRSGQALKVSRGMTTLVSQTLPTDRIQGITVTQHLLWRPFGLHRVSIDVLGYGSGDEEDSASDILLPAGTSDEVALAIDAVWPGFRLDQVQMHPAPPRARKLHPFIWKSLRWGRTEDVFVAADGGLVRTTSVVHHARVQSAHLRAGPLQRRLGLADVQLDTTGSTLLAHELDQHTARELVLAQMETCREARRRDAKRRQVAPPRADTDTAPVTGYASLTVEAPGLGPGVGTVAPPPDAQD